MTFEKVHWDFQIVCCCRNTPLRGRLRQYLFQQLQSRFHILSVFRNAHHNVPAVKPGPVQRGTAVQPHTGQLTASVLRRDVDQVIGESLQKRRVQQSG